MTDRELELAAAKMADKLSTNSQCSNESSLMLSGRIIGIVLQLRREGLTNSSKMLRVLLMSKKGQFISKIAKDLAAPKIQEYKQEFDKVKLIRDQEESKYHEIYTKWHEEVKSLPLARRLFNKPPPPVPERRTPYPVRPDPVYLYEIKMKKLEFGEILVNALLHHKFPHPEHSDKAVNHAYVLQVLQEHLAGKLYSNSP